MIATKTSRQIRNRQLRDMGIRPAESYHTRVGPLDHVAVLEVTPDAEPRRFVARVTNVRDHGWYLLLDYEPLESDDELQPGTIRLYRAGPPDWGVVELKVVKKVARISPRRGLR